MKQQTLRWLEPLIIYIVTRGLLMAVAFFADLFYPDPIGTGFYHVAPQMPWLDVWARWDSAFYLGIASQGYQLNLTEISNIAFFPLYPLLIRCVDFVVNQPLISALIVSHLAFLAALYTLNALCRFERFSESVRLRTLWLTATFPGAFFFSAVYSESLFLLLSLLVFYFARQKNWAFGVLFAILAGATRITGILLTLVLFLEWWRTQPRQLKTGFLLLLAPLGLVSHMVFLGVTYADPIAFWNVQSAFNRTEINPLAAIWRDLEPLITGSNTLPWNVVFDLTAFVLVLICLPLIQKQLGISFSLYSLFSVLIPISSGTGSLLRYVSILFPVMIALALMLQNRRVYVAVQTFFFALMLILAGVFANWIFVA